MRDHEIPEIERQIDETASAGILWMIRGKLSDEALENANENDDPESYNQRFNEFLEQLIQELEILRNNPLDVEIRFKSDLNDPE